MQPPAPPEPDMDMTEARAAAGLEQPVVWPLTSHRRSLPITTALTPMEGSHLALFLIDTMSGQVAYWDRDLLCRFANSAYLAWFGKHQTSIIGCRAQDVLGDELYTRDEPHIFAALNGERRQFERRCVKPDGSIGHVLVCYIPDIAHDEVIGFIAPT